jgi:Domain of unknown function (DUF4440)
VSARGLSFFVDLERAVWTALVEGDADADRAVLADSFVGVYPTGFAGADDHAAQLVDGPTVDWFELDGARILEIADGHVMLSYRASYRRPGSDTVEVMYVSSLWSRLDDRWLNVFSQDTPAGGSVV